MHTWLPREMELLIATMLLLCGITTTQAGLPREMQLLITTMILFGGITTTQTEFVSTPTSVNATLGSTATFNCSATGIIYWIVNGSLLTELNQSDITISYDGRTHFMNLSATKKYNNTVVVCEVILRDPILHIKSSDPAVLRVQGYPAAVGNLTVHSHQSSILLTWTPPFSLDITGVNPDFWYCVEVYNITWGRAPLTTNYSVYEPQFYFTAPNHSRCDLFEFRVFAVNQVGNGSVVSVNGTYITKPSSDAVGIQVEFLSIMEIEVKLLFISSVNIYNGRVFAINKTGSTSLGGIKGTGISNLVIHITDCTLQFNHNYTMTMEVGEGDRSVLMIGDLSTFDIKTALVNSNSPGAVNVVCTFATNSQALGFLVVLHPWNTTQTEIFAYAARDNRHAPTANITIHGVPIGNYTVLVFDGEYNGLPSERAAITPQNITVTGGDLDPVVGFGASINTTENQICVSCPDDGVSRGCVIVLRHSQELQSIMSHNIPRTEVSCFHQEKSGDYTVAVFKQIINKTLNAIPLNVSVVSLSSSTPTTRITPTTLITDIVPTIHTTAATLKIAVVVTGVSAFIVGALVGVLVYHCISKHRSAQFIDKPESSSHHQQQTEPEYEMPATSGKEEVKLRKNMAYDPVQRIELRGNVAYGPVQN